jgi:hypothetical protein
VGIGGWRWGEGIGGWRWGEGIGGWRWDRDRGVVLFTEHCKNHSIKSAPETLDDADHA